MEEKIVRAWRTPEKQMIARRLRLKMTPQEALLWDKLRANRLHRLYFRRQQIIGGFIADFYCRAARLIVECDGAMHDDQADYDRERDRILALYNLRILRVSNDRIEKDLAGVQEEIRRLAGA